MQTNVSSIYTEEIDYSQISSDMLSSGSSQKRVGRGGRGGKPPTLRLVNPDLEQNVNNYHKRNFLSDNYESIGMNETMH